jgi:hypothetical protein
MRKNDWRDILRERQGGLTGLSVALSVHRGGPVARGESRQSGQQKENGPPARAAAPAECSRTRITG